MEKIERLFKKHLAFGEIFGDAWGPFVWRTPLGVACFLTVKIYSGNSNQPLAKAICKYIGVNLGRSDVSQFPDGETFVKIEENVRGSDVFVIQSTCPPTNHNLMELFIMIDALKGQVQPALRRLFRFMVMHGRTAKTSLVSRLRPNWSPTCWLRLGQTVS